MNRLHFDGKTYQVAGSWNELTPAQLLRLVRVLCATSSEGQRQARVVAILLQRYQWYRAGLTRRMRYLPEPALAELSRLASFAVQAPVQLTHQLLPELRPSWWGPTWYGPGDMLRGLTFAEWIDAEDALFRFRQNQDVRQLDRLVAVLYRPGRQAADVTTGDRRPVYRQHEVAARAAQAARLPLHVRKAVLFYYDSCRQRLVEAYPDVFTGGGEGTGQARNPSTAYLRLLRELAGGAEKFEVIGRQPIGNILFDVDGRLEEVNRIKAETPRS